MIDYSEVLSNRLNVNIKRIISYYVLGNLTISCTDLGWGTNYNSKNAKDLAETGKTASKRHTRENINSDKCQQIFQENIFILESIIQWSSENNIKVLLFIPPAFETYRQNLNHEQLKITTNTARNIGLKYDNCIYSNLLSDTNFVATDFYDADHLSEIGAKKLSVLINERINKWK